MLRQVRISNFQKLKLSLNSTKKPLQRIMTWKLTGNKFKVLSWNKLDSSNNRKKMRMPPN
jgi:hypothetical protein